MKDLEEFIIEDKYEKVEKARKAWIEEFTEDAFDRYVETARAAGIAIMLEDM